MEIPLSIDSQSRRPLVEQIADQLLAMIRHGRLSIGDHLPPTRELSVQLGVSRNTVVAAYNKLITEGWLEASGRGGTRVALHSQRMARHVFPKRNGEAPPNSKHPTLSQAAIAARAGRFNLFDPVRSRLALDFRVGMPDRSLYPYGEWTKCVKERLSRSARGFTEYGNPLGDAELRSAIAHLVRLHRGVVCSSDQVIVTNGIQQGLNLAARLLIEPGSVVAVETPTYASAAGIFTSYGARLAACPIGTEGIDCASLPEEGAKAMYVTPSHQFPLGSTMALDTRLALLDWARSTGTYILEDDYDSDFRYRGAPLQALASLDSHELVIYLGTFSKTMGAGLRLGYMIVPPSLVHPMSALKDLMDHGTSWLEQVALADFIKLGHYERHVRRVKTAYGGRCELLADALGKLVNDSIIMGGDGGMHLTWVLPPRLPIARELQRELEVLGVGVYTLEEGPALCIGTSDLMERVLLLGYPCLSEHQIATATDLIGEVMQSIQAQSGS